MMFVSCQYFQGDKRYEYWTSSLLTCFLGFASGLVVWKKNYPAVDSPYNGEADSVHFVLAEDYITKL